MEVCRQKKGIAKLRFFSKKKKMEPVFFFFFRSLYFALHPVVRLKITNSSWVFDIIPDKNPCGIHTDDAVRSRLWSWFARGLDSFDTHFFG